jgi:precorrin-6A/cobalt-precorrin-6A reductase
MQDYFPESGDSPLLDKRSDRKIILLVGGTSETAPLAEQLALAGFRVLVSVATEVPLNLGNHPHIEARTGPLDGEGLESIILSRSVKAVVDASHPYASEIRLNTRAVTEKLGMPLFTWIRPPAARHEDPSIDYAKDHEDAARRACSVGRPVLLTTGSRNLIPYVREASRAGVDLVARVIPSEESVRACRQAGIREDRIIYGRGPFTLEENRSAIRRFGIGVLVTKDSGAAGGFREKIAAAIKEETAVIVIRRPEGTASGSFASLEDLVQIVVRTLGSDSQSI